MSKLLMAILVLWVPLTAVAGKPECVFPIEIVKQSPPQNAATVAAYYWESGRDKDSDEHLKTLYITYKNGDHAVIQHKYCSMYNFEIIYLRNSQVNDLDAGAIAKIVTGLYTQYAAKKATFTRPMEDIISKSLKERSFSIDKNISIELPESDARYPNARVEFSLDYKTLGEFSNIYSSVTKFYLGIGGMT